MSLEGQIINFQIKLDGFKKDFNELKLEIIRIHKENERRSDSASSQSGSGAKKVLLGAGIGALGLGVTILSGGVLFPLVASSAGAAFVGASVGVGVVGASAGAITFASGVSDVTEGIVSQGIVLQKSVYDNMEASRKIEIIKSNIHDEIEASKSVLEQMKEKFELFIQNLERINRDLNYVDDVKNLIAGLKSIIKSIDSCTKRIKSNFRENTYSDMENDLMKFANDFHKISKQVTSESLILLFKDKTSDFESKILEMIHLSLSYLGSYMKAMKLMCTCGNKIQRFHNANPSVGLIDEIVGELDSLGAAYDECLNLMRDFKKMSNLHDEHEEEIRRRDEEIAQLRSQFAQMRGLRN